MPSVSIRFYAELNDFLPPAARGKTREYHFVVPGAVKDVIEGLGVPHTEVDLVLVNGVSVGFDQRVRDGDRIAVYPVFESIDITPVLKVRPRPLRHLRFVADVHLGRLAAYLRLAGFDTVYRNDATDEQLAALAAREQRILLSRDRGLLKRSAVTRGHYVRATAPRRQLAELVERFDLGPASRPFTRCLACNGVLEAAEPRAVAGRVPDRVRRRHPEYRRCRACGRVYWKGSHYRRLERILAEALHRAGG